MKRKNGFTFMEHVQTGEVLYHVRNYLIHLVPKVCSVYPKQSKPMRSVAKALKAVDALRSHLDDCVCNEYREKPDGEVLKFYFK